MPRCLACGRMLTDPESIERGIGPVCLEHDLEKNKFQKDLFATGIDEDEKQKNSKEVDQE